MTLFPEPEVNPARSRAVKQYAHGSPLLCAGFDPAGRFAFAGAEDRTIQRWDLGNDNKVSLTGHESWPSGLAFVPRGNKLVSAGCDGRLIWWPVDADGPRPERTVDAHDGWVRAVAVSPDGRLVASCGNDRLVKLWSAEGGEPVRTLEGHDCHVYNVAFHPGGRFLVSADHHGRVRQWDLTTWEQTRTLDAGELHRYDTTFRATIGGIRGIDFSADGALLACGGITNVSNAFAGIGEPAVVVFQWESGEKRLLKPQQTARARVWGVRFHPSGFLAAAGGGSAGGLWFWRPDQERSYASVALPNNARGLDLHPDGFRLAVPCYDRNLRIYDMRPGG